MAEPPPQATSKDLGKSEDGTDLATLLKKEQCADLTLLVANITEAMRKLILENFDASAGLDKKLLRQGMTEDEKLMAADPGSADVSAYDRERKLKAEIEKDLATLKMKNLKKNSLKSFDDWREQVILRVGQVVNSEETAQEQVKKGAKADVAKPRAPNTSGKVMEAGKKTVSLKFKDVFPPTKTPLTKMAMNQRTLVLHSLLLLLLSLEHYNAYSRILLLNLTSSLKLPLKTFEQDEYATAKGLLEAAKEMSADDEIKQKINENEETRKRKVRYARVAGAAILGVTGSMAAPLVAAGVGSVMGGLGLGATTAATYLGSVAGSTVLVGSLFGAYGGKMTGQMMDSYAREVEDFQFLPVHGNSDKKTSENEEQGAQEASEHDHKLRVTIGISGWLTAKEEVVQPWRSLGTAAEVFALKYELEALLNLGNAMNGMVQSAAWGYAQKEMIAQTIFADLAAAMWPMALMKVARVIDNPFSVAKSRADKAGEVLADALVNRAQGERPVTLIGYSLGARVIYTCLMSLAKRKEFGLVESAVLIGTPTPSDTSDWRVLRSAVAGRLVNVYSVNDYVLGFMYRTSAIQYGVAGLQKVEGLAAVENFDVSEDVSSHQKYRYLIGAILRKIGFEDIDMAAVEREQQELIKMEQEEKKATKAAQKKWLMRRDSNGGKVDEAAEGEAEASELEKKVQEQTQKSLVSRAIEYFYLPSVPSAKDAQTAAGNLQKAAQNPALTANVASQTAKDIQASTQTYATYIYKNLPSMPHINRSKPASTVEKSAPIEPAKTKQATEAAEAATDQAQSYVQQASKYLPSLPNMPSRSSSGKAKAGKTKQPETTNAASRAADTSTATTKGTAGAASDMLNTTVKNTLDPKDNPAVKTTKQAADKTPIIHKAKERTPGPVVEGAGEVTGAVGKTVQNTTQTVQKGLDTSTEKAGVAGEAAAGRAQSTGEAVAEGAQDAGQTATGGAQSAAKTGQSYTSKAASYLPNMRFGLGGAKKASPPKLEKKPSEATSTPKKRPESKSTPQLDRTPSGVKSPPAKLDRTPSGVKSPPPKLDRTPSGVRSPPAKLDRTPSGMTGLLAKLDRTPPGAKSPPAKVNRTASGVKSPPKLGPRKTSSQRGQSFAPPTPGAIEERLASVTQGAAVAGKKAGEGAAGAGGIARGAGGRSTSTVQKAGNSASEGAKEVGGAASSTAQKAGRVATEPAKSAGGAASGTAQTAGNTATESAKQLGGAAMGAATQAGSALTGALGSMTGTGASTMKQADAKDESKPDTGSPSGPTSSPPGADAAKGAATSTSDAAGKAGVAGLNAAKTGGRYLSGMGKKVGLGR